MIKSRDKHEASFIMGMKEILDFLANEDALKIFSAAKDGIVSSTKAIEELGVTEKRYYTRLRELLKAGLIEKTEGMYRYTAFGKLLFEILFKRLRYVLANRDRLELLDKLVSSTAISSAEVDEIAAVILDKRGVIGFTDLLGAFRPVEVVGTYEELKSALIRLIEKAEREIYMATRYTDSSVTETVLRVYGRGVKMFFLDGDKMNLSRKMQMLGVLISKPKMVKNLHDFLSSPNVAVKYVDLPSSFLVVDEKYAGIEIMNPITNTFLLGLIFQSKTICVRLIEIFKALWEKAGEDPLKAFLMSLK